MTGLDRERTVQDKSDHDLLITLHEQVQGIRADIKELKDGTSIRIADHETRIRRLEYGLALAMGLSFAIQFYFNYLRV